VVIDTGMGRRTVRINPLAIGVTLGGLLLDIVAPRPKPRVGNAQGALPCLPRHRLEDTVGHVEEQHEFASVASAETP
jgi:hypothetical protein